MNQSLLEHIEAKIINFLHDAKAPHHASQIAARIRERREDTLHAIQKLVNNKTVRGVQDLTLFGSTGETMAYTLADTPAGPAPVMPSVPPSRLSPPHHSSAPGG